MTLILAQLFHLEKAYKTLRLALSNPNEVQRAPHGLNPDAKFLLFLDCTKRHLYYQEYYSGS